MTDEIATALPLRDGPDRRGFIAGTGAAAVALVVSGTAVIHPSEAWGLEAPNLGAPVMRTLIKAARDIFPHDRIPDKFYAVAMKAYEDKASSDPKMKAMMEDGVKILNDAAQKAFKVNYADVGWESQRVGILKGIQKTAFFKKIRGDLVVSLYNQKEVWPIFGYEGESASKGGYINRGFGDIAWL